MNKELEKYIDQGMNDCYGPWEVSMRAAFQVGFKHAINLDLPIKFNKWMIEVRDDWPVEEVVKLYKENEWKEASIEELYEYWINNAFKNDSL